MAQIQPILLLAYLSDNQALLSKEWGRVMEEHEIVTLETVLTLTKKLNAVNKLKLIEQVLQELEPIVEAHEPKRQKSLRCVLKGHTLTEEEIVEARKEIGGMTEKIPKRVVQLGGLSKQEGDRAIRRSQ